MQTQKAMSTLPCRQVLREQVTRPPESYVHFTMHASSSGINDKTPKKSLIKCNRTAKDDVLRGSWGGKESLKSSTDQIQVISVEVELPNT